MAITTWIDPSDKTIDWRVVQGATGYPIVPKKVDTQAQVLQMRPKPSFAPISGYLTLGHPPAAGRREVILRISGSREELYRTFSDPVTGYFEFLEWIPVRSDYELLIQGDNYVSEVFPLLQSALVQWNGNPSWIPST